MSREVHSQLSHLGSQILPPTSYDITSSNTTPLQQALQGADAVVSMVGLLAASASRMYEVQQRGAERVAEMAKEQGVGRVVMISAIGSNKDGVTP